jgi:hypothetical protein
MKQWIPKATLLVIALGFMLRVIQFLFNRSLQVDEAMLSLNIVHRGFSEVLLPLDMNQSAPVLFLILEKLAVVVFGNMEYALRLLPLTSSVICLLLIHRVTLRLTHDHLASFFSAVMFAFSKTMIFYATEAKHYSSDVLVMLSLYFIFFSNHYWIMNRRYQFGDNRNIPVQHSSHRHRITGIGICDPPVKNEKV